ncbi:hypothetical protein AB6813_15250 [bacterium RCC_150]
MHVNKIGFWTMEEAYEKGLPLNVDGFGYLLANEPGVQLTLAGDRAYLLMPDLAAWRGQKGVHLSLSHIRFQACGFPQSWNGTTPDWKPVTVPAPNPM